MLDELGISLGTAIVVCVVIYYVIKSSVKNGISEMLEKHQRSSELSESSKVLQSYVGKNCTITTSMDSLLFAENGFKIDCQVLNADPVWINIRYKDKDEYKEKSIRIMYIDTIEGHVLNDL